ncbi:MAG: ABC transporter permease [Gammaproteobacteria bacterium]|nr:ABC transporter permease [Gammaproteobacteria bacterium]MDD9810630.1 ABC transporter permease [Gammaproteobacteria bacterium]MDD9822002.1 ABC transporter permease [Gammaproteobacteria bacterium]MDD9854955.1 ABC transporter permease [Gammaproteobacteria bacterium]MDD9884022.1 ABC transporter permease [Gammaproteobacteria bacterium]
MNAVLSIFKRELSGYFGTPIAYVFLVIFLLLSGIFTFYLGQFFDRGQADLVAFFSFHPWLYLFLVPALSMRLWAEERRTGTVELLLTLPVTPWQAVLGKFLASWLFIAVALLLTMPLWVTVNFLGDPDNGVITASYVGSLLMAGAYLAVGASVSALTRNQVIAFVLSMTLCFLLVLSGFPLVLDLFSSWAPDLLVDAVASLSFLTHFSAVTRGVIDLQDLVYFISMTGFFLFVNTVIVELKKSE